VFIPPKKPSGNLTLPDGWRGNMVPGPPSFGKPRPAPPMLVWVGGGFGPAAFPAMSMPTSEHTLLTHLPLVAPEVKRTVGLIRRRGRIQSYIAAELEKQITEQYRRT
ncbi:LysR family transcriptional regulator, partial [Enterobacter roggenkampii]